MHFTRVEHLASILREGLCSDTIAQDGLTQVEIGNRSIEDQRRHRVVNVGHGGVVADYVPFYFAPRSPMLYAIHRGNVPTYSEGCDRLIYLATSVESLTSQGLPVVLSDRNAAAAVAEFLEYDGDPLPEDFIDWPLMRATYWNSSPEQPDRRERRMAECLVHGRVPAHALEFIVTKSEAVCAEAREILHSAGVDLPVHVRTSWYF
ncbi:type II toxin-antitoxin system toxin DNA ADP-ribosyl transferase DarT [Aeromicrobium piscarium]|nr:DUF4433 domain-containing protein [Aeromicrobium piscarium]